MVMDISTILFFIIGFGALIGGFILEGGKPTALIAGPAALIILGGTIAAVGLSFPVDVLKRFPKVLGIFFKPPKHDLPEEINYFKEVSYKVRKEGILSLESEVSSNPDLDPFIKKGLQLVADGIEADTVRSILEVEVEAMSERHREGMAMFESAGGYSPTMGIIGTVLSLVNALANMNSGDIGEKVSGAFIATLYGIGLANIVWLPIAAKLKEYDARDFAEKNMIIEAIILIQEGVNPNTLGEKLKGYLTKEQLVDVEKNEKGAAA
jgi:chemotaxis protein MotA